MNWTAIISAVSAISAVVIGWVTMFSKIKKQIERDSITKTKSEAYMQSNLDYIRIGIDEMRLEQKDQGRRFDALSERVTRVEESAKQAHKRIDRLDGGRSL